MVEATEKQKWIGTKLMKEAEEIAKKKNLKKIELWAYPQDNSIDSSDLRDFYEGLGYDVVDEFDAGMWMYYDMEKKL